MDTAMPQKNLERVLDKAIRETTQQATGVSIHPSRSTPGGDLCTVYITFRRGFHTSLSLCADTALMVRMARNALELEEPTAADLEDFCKEYFNILCGKIAAALFRHTRVPARFSVPAFHQGRFVPKDHRTQFILTYSDDHKDSFQLIHHVPRAH